ncbi:hypothetical protein PNO24_05140 [Gemella haemolysans]|uniref:hypothetical protein n=1 Tax=Gemella haemolysans TaxID=1379 RepID=UPI00232C3D4E|nr:hypothetical protein [Gemella haemolysans]MDB6213310.1 hypothetical protein [Gemella haemolysans]
MSKTKLTRRILTGLVLLVGASGAVTVANEVNNAAVNVNKKDVKASVYEKDGHYYVKLTTAKNVTNVVARVTTEDRKEYVVKKEAIKAGEVVEYEIDINADVPTRKLPHTAVKRETVKSVVTLGNHTFNAVVSYDVEVAGSQEQATKPVDKNTEKKTTLDQLAEKREVTAEQKAKEEAEAKKVAEAKAVADAKAKQEADAKVKAAKEAEAKKAAETKATEDAKLKQEADAKAKAAKEAEAKKTAEAKAAADAKLKQETEAKAAKEAEAKKAAELKAKQEADAKAKAAKEAEAKKAAEAKQTTTVAGGLPEVTAAELADPAMNGLTPHTKKMKVALAKKFGITSFSLFRAGDDDGTGHGHNSGMAVDFMVPVSSAQGDQLAEYLTKHMDELGVYYIIWKQKYYMAQNNIYGPANTWNIMPDRGGVTANHYDHVHVSFKK